MTVIKMADVQGEGAAPPAPMAVQPLPSGESLALAAEHLAGSALRMFRDIAEGEPFIFRDAAYIVAFDQVIVENAGDVSIILGRLLRTDGGDLLIYPESIRLETLIQGILHGLVTYQYLRPGCDRRMTSCTRRADTSGSRVSGRHAVPNATTAGGAA